MKTRLAGLLFLLALPQLSGCGWPGYEWQLNPPGPVILAEHGQRMQLIDISVRETSSPWNPWHDVLLEQSTGEAGHDAYGVPVLPRNINRVSKTALAEVYALAAQYRGSGNLLDSAKYLFVDIGTFKVCWVVGSQPFAFATLDPAPDLERYRAIAASKTWRPTTTTAGYVITTREDGTTKISDGRAKASSLVRDADLGKLANVVVIYPEDFEPRWAAHYPLGPRREPHEPGLLVVMQRARPLTEIIDLLSTDNGHNELRAGALFMSPIVVRR